MDSIENLKEILGRILRDIINYEESVGSRWTACTFCTSERVLIESSQFKEANRKDKNEQRGEKIIGKRKGEIIKTIASI